MKNTSDLALNFHRILVVDDMPAIHDDFQRILFRPEPDTGLTATEAELFGLRPISPSKFIVDCAESGKAGCEMLQSAQTLGRPYSMAFVDMRMPAGWDGLRTVEELWRIDPNLHVVICTAYSDYPLEPSLSGLGRQDKLLVLKKPFDPIEVVQLARALTAKRRLEAETAAHLATLEATLEALQQATLEVRAHNDQLETYATALARRLRSPWNVFAPILNRLSSPPGERRSEDAIEHLHKIMVGARQGEEFLLGVMALSDVARAKLYCQLIDLSAVASEVMEDLRKRYPTRKVSLTVQDGMRAVADVCLIRLLMKRLLENAWKFTSNGAMAVISVGCRDDGVTERSFFVSDSGMNFDGASMGELFKRLRRPEGAQRYDAGGGLVVAGRIIERHGGRIWVESSPGAGWRIHFTLPTGTQSYEQTAAV